MTGPSRGQSPAGAGTASSSPSTREGFGITYAEAMAADCTVIAADHHNSAADEVIGEGGYLTAVTEDAVAETLSRALNGKSPEAEPVERARQYDWDNVATQAEQVYRTAVERRW